MTLRAQKLKKKMMLKEVNESQKQIVAPQEELSASNQKVRTPKSEREELQGTIEALCIEISQVRQKNASLQRTVGDLRDELEYVTKYNEEMVREAKYEAKYVRTTLQFLREEIFAKEEAWRQKKFFHKNVLCEKRKSLEADRMAKPNFTKDEAGKGNMNSVNRILCDQ